MAYAAEAVELLRAFPSDRPDDLPTALLYYSFALTYPGRPAEALPIAQEGIAIESARAPSALLAYLHMAVGEAGLFQGDAEVEKPIEHGIAEMGIGTLLLNHGNSDEAQVHTRRALDIFVRRWGPHHAYTGRAHALLARIAVRRGDSATTGAEIAAAVKALEQSRLGLVDWITIELELSQVLFAAGRIEESVERLRRCPVSPAPRGRGAGGVPRGLRHAIRRLWPDPGFDHRNRRATSLPCRRLGRYCRAYALRPALPPDTVAAIQNRARGWHRAAPLIPVGAQQTE